jgi:hypothetical protein
MPWESHISEGVQEATDGEGRVVCFRDDEESDFSFGLGGHGLHGHILGRQSVHSTQGLQDSQGDWSQEREAI